jgi:hypothetical protein
VGRSVRLLGGGDTLYAFAGRGLEVRRGLVKSRQDIEKNKGFWCPGREKGRNVVIMVDVMVVLDFPNLGMEWNGMEQNCLD